MKDEESLHSRTLICQLTDTVQNQIDDVLVDGVIPPGIVVCSILLAGYQLFWAEQLVICSGSNLIDNSRFQVNKPCFGDMLASSCFAEESVEAVVSVSHCLVR
jgi:hypothetical protein